MITSDMESSLVSSLVIFSPFSSNEIFRNFMILIVSEIIKTRIKDLMRLIIVFTNTSLIDKKYLFSALQILPITFYF
jgi:hypothetical protein